MQEPYRCGLESSRDDALAKDEEAEPLLTIAPAQSEPSLTLRSRNAGPDRPTR